MVTGEFYDTHRMMEASFYKRVLLCNRILRPPSSPQATGPIPSKAREACLAVIAQGYDVLFPCLDAAGAGVAAAAPGFRNVKVVGRCC